MWADVVEFENGAQCLCGSALESVCFCRANSSDGEFGISGLVRKHTELRE